MRLEGARVTLGVLIFAVVAVCPAVAQQAPETPQRPGTAERVGVSAALGVSWPAEDIVADVYGSAMPVTIQGDVRLFGRVAVFGGFKSLRKDGQSVVLGPVVADERYPTSLSVTSLRFGATVALPVARGFTAAGSVGVAVNWYEERWPYAQAAAAGHPVGVVVQGEVRYALHSRWSVVGRVEYAPVATQTAGTSSVADVNLGGVDLCAGIRMGF